MSDSSAESTPPPAPITVVSGLMLLGFIIIALAAFEAAGIMLIHMSLEVFFASFLLLWHWATVEKNEFSRLPHSVIGALVGVALAWWSGFAVAHFGMPNGLIMGLVPIIVALFLVIMNWIPVAFNSSAMLFVTVLGAPALAKGANYVDLSIAVVLGGAFFSAAVWLALQYVTWRGKAKAAKAARATGSGTGAVAA